MNTVNSMDKDAIIKWMENWRLSLNARTNFYKFIDATTKNEDVLIDECQKIYDIIDNVVLTKEKKQFQQTLDVGTVCYRARIIDSNFPHHLV